MTIGDVALEDTGLDDYMKKFVSAYIKTARTLLEKQGEFSPMCFIGANEGKDVAIFPFGTAPSKDAAADMMRQICKRSRATWIILMMEAYIPAETFTYADLQAALDKYGSVQDMPGRREIFSISVETRMSSWMGIAVQEKRDDGTATFGEVMFSAHGQSSGRFVGLLPKEGREH